MSRIEPGLHGHLPRAVGRMIEDQVGRWMLQHVGDESTSSALSKALPVVTISRQFGSRATELGHRIADRLGFAYWDRGIVTAIANALQVDESTVEQLDERTRNSIEELLSVTLFGQPATEADYDEELRRLVRALERQGSAVIIGRGAQYVVSPERSLRVRLIGPLNKRVADYRARTGVSEDEARRRVREADQERIDFVRHEFDQNIDDPSFYDLVLNAESYPMDRAESLVLAAYSAKFGELLGGGQNMSRS